VDETASSVTRLELVAGAARVLVAGSSDDGSSALQVAGTASLSGNMLMPSVGATQYLGTAAGSGAIANDNGSNYFVLYGHSNAATGNADLIGANLRVQNGLVSSALGYKAASTVAFMQTQEYNTLAANTQSAITSIPQGSLIVVRNITDGDTGVFLVDVVRATPTLMFQTGTNMNAGDSGASTSKICVTIVAGAVNVYNRFASAKRISVAIFAASASDGREIATRYGAVGFAVAASTCRTASTWSSSARR